LGITTRGYGPTIQRIEKMNILEIHQFSVGQRVWALNADGDIKVGYIQEPVLIGDKKASISYYLSDGVVRYSQWNTSDLASAPRLTEG